MKPSMTLSTPTAALTEHAELPSAFGGDLVESVKGSAPTSTPGAPGALDSDRINTLHRKLGFVDLYNTGNELTRNG